MPGQEDTSVPGVAHWASFCVGSVLDGGLFDDLADKLLWAEKEHFCTPALIEYERMLPLPWKTLTSPDSNKEYLALLSFLPLKHYRTIPKFFWLTFETQRQLHKSKGLIGYSLHAQPLRRQFWTLSVWEDQQSLMDFVRQVPHGKIMQALASQMGRTQFVQWKVTARDIPPGWEQARTRMA